LARRDARGFGSPGRISRLSTRLAGDRISGGVFMPQAGGNLELSIGALRDAMRCRTLLRGARTRMAG
jgi:hypothetical protein